MRYRILGPVKAYSDGRPIALRASQLRAVLAVLLIRHGHVVPTHALFELLWGSRPPHSCRASLQLRVSQLRKLIGSQRLVFETPGYTLLMQPEDLDLVEFNRLARQGSESLARGNPGDASEALHAALALWQGEALENVQTPGAAPYAIRLNELRLAAVADRIEADLCLGRRHLIPELEALTAAWPLNERLRGQLMLALYREGRPADALASYRGMREHLSAELGLDPCPALSRLERAILRHDPALESRS